MKLLLIIAVLGLPVMEIWGYFKIGSMYGWWYFFYILLMGFLGWRMVKEEKAQLLSNMMNFITLNHSPFSMILGVAKNMIAGGLFLFPGIFTDIFAVCILLIPMKQKNTSFNSDFFSKMNEAINPNNNKHQSKDNNDIEGEFHREKND
jgi:UPF0716 protein FxsA